MTTTTNSLTSAAPLRQINTQPKIVFSRRAWFLCWLYVHICDVEISFMGRVIEKTDDDGKMFFYIDDIFLLKQVCGPAETTIDPVALSELLHSLPPEDFDRIRFWGHSHVNMGVFWSGTDYAAMKQLRGGGTNIYTVFNKKHETRTCLDYVNGQHDYRIDDIKGVTYDKPDRIEMLTPIVDAYAAKYELDPDKVESMLLNFMRTHNVDLEDDLSFPEDLEAFAKQEYATKVSRTKPYYGYGYDNYAGRGKHYERLSYYEEDALELMATLGYDALSPQEKAKVDKIISEKRALAQDWIRDEFGSDVVDIKSARSSKRTRPAKTSKDGRSFLK